MQSLPIVRKHEREAETLRVPAPFGACAVMLAFGLVLAGFIAGQVL